MNKLLKITLTSALVVSGLFGCASKDDKNNKSNNANTSIKEDAEDVKDDVAKTIDDVMDYFKKQKVEIGNVQTIDKIDFAAYEGKSFEVNGKTVYLYRVNDKDENMKKLIQQAKDTGKITVNINNKEQEYRAKVKGNLLMLYSSDEDMNDIIKSFDTYQNGTRYAEPYNKPESNTNLE